MIDSKRRGQVLPGAVAILVILAILVPAMVYWIQREAVDASKQASNTNSFHLAESGTEKAYLYITQSTATWVAIQAGTAQTDYSFDKTFTDIPGGTYTISINSGPLTQQATIVAVGRDKLKRETRALRVVYSNVIFGATAIYAGTGVQIGGGVNVDWGAVMSPYTIEANSKNHPQFWSASKIVTKDTNPDPPNCDGPACCQWHSYQANLPVTPAVDFDFYRASAAATTGCPAGGSPANSCYYASTSTAINDWNEATTKTPIFVDGNLTVTAPGMFHSGTMIVMGNINLPNGAWGRGSVTMDVPPDAWKQYCNDWDIYISSFDPAGPAAFPGLTDAYAPTGLTYASTKIAINGFLYVGKNFNNGGGGGGNSDIYGVLFSVGSSTQTAASPVNFYYNGAATSPLQATNVSLTRVSWRNEVRGWPPSAP